MGSDVSTAEADPLIPIVNEFSFHFYKAIASQSDNEEILFSPSSLAAGLALMHFGAKKKTAEEISLVMDFEQFESSDLHASVGALRGLLFGGSGTCKFHGASKIFCSKDVKVSKKFRKLAQDFYQTVVEGKSFSSPEVVAQDLNHWLKETGISHGDDIITNQDLGMSDRLIMINALNFAGTLMTPFRKSSTKIAKFFPSDAENYNVPMMNVKCSFPYFYDGEMKCQVLEMPYEGNNFRIILILPDVTSGLKEVESRLTVQNLQKWCRPREMDVVDVYLPRFNLNQMNIPNNILMQLGISALFDPNKAELSGIGDNLVLSRFFHYARVGVSETESPEAGNMGDVHGFVVSCETFRADRPFLFLVQDKRKGAIIFMGRQIRPPEISAEELKEIYRRAKERLREQTKSS